MSSVFDPPGNRREHFPHEPTDDQYLVEIAVIETYTVPADGDCDEEAIDNAIRTFEDSADKKAFLKGRTTEEKVIEYPNEG